MASGDLTDAKTKDAIGSDQFEGEWKHYRDILTDAHVTQKTLWLDIRGNHGKKYIFLILLCFFNCINGSEITV